MPTTSNFGWTTPADTDLVKDGAAAIRTLGNGIDTSLVGLKGGTTGQILSKTSNTDLAYTWINNDQGDITAVTAGTGLTGGGTTGAVTLTNDMATAIDAKGDIIAGTGADAYARLAVGANNTVLTADSTTATGLKWATPSSGGYTSLASGSLSGSSTLAMSSIPNTYRDLVLVIRDFYGVTDNMDLRLRFNNDSTANRHTWALFGNNTNTFNGTSIVIANSQDNGGSDALCIVQIPDYANTSTWKMCVVQAAANNNTTPTSVTQWCANGFYNQTGAIDRLDITNTAGGSPVNFSGGTFELFGVK